MYALLFVCVKYITAQICSRFLEREIHWDLDANHGTARALDELGAIPESIPLDISIGTVSNSAVSQ
jgi:hypothetical protein